MVESNNKFLCFKNIKYIIAHGLILINELIINQDSQALGLNKNINELKYIVCIF